jgi:hypothetical protein
MLAYISEAKATTKTTAKAKANTGVLHYVQDDESCWDASFCKGKAR